MQAGCWGNWRPLWWRSLLLMDRRGCWCNDGRMQLENNRAKDKLYVPRYIKFDLFQDNKDNRGRILEGRPLGRSTTIRSSPLAQPLLSDPGWVRMPRPSSISVLSTLNFLSKGHQPGWRCPDGGEASSVLMHSRLLACTTQAAAGARGQTR